MKRILREITWVVIALGSVVLNNDSFASQDTDAKSILDQLAAKIHRPAIEVELPNTGNKVLGVIDSVSVDDLRGVIIDDNAPVLNATTTPSYCEPGVTPAIGALICLNAYTDWYSDGTGAYLNNGYSGVGSAPYVAKDVRPFRFQYFNNSLDYSGWNSENLHDYASLHGYSQINPYNWFGLSYWDSTVKSENHYPTNTGLFKSVYAGDISQYPTAFRWDTTGGAMVKITCTDGQPCTDGRYDMLPALPELITQLNTILSDPNRVTNPLYAGRNPNPFVRDPLLRLSTLMIDMEHQVLPSNRVNLNDCANPATECLQKQTWYPKNASLDQQLAFEAQYYTGYANTYIAAIEVARLQGWPTIGECCLSPLPDLFIFLNGKNIVLDSDPNDVWNWQWNSFSRMVHEHVDVEYPGVYPLFWDERHLAAGLAQVDLISARTAAKSKPIQPYLWTRLEGPGAKRWWYGQPMPSNEARAIFAMTFFTGAKGLVNWDVSNISRPYEPAQPILDNFHVPTLDPKLEVFAKDTSVGLNVAVGTPVDPSQVVPEANGGIGYTFKSGDVLHVLNLDASKNVMFQVIDKNTPPDYGVDWTLPAGGVTKPTYVLSMAELSKNVLPNASSLAPSFEGLALVKPFEYLLRYGDVKIDVSAQQQFQTIGPVVRRVKFGNYSILITYDPQSGRPGYTPRTVTLTDFDQTPGLNLTLLADNQTRIYVVKAPTTDLSVRVTAPSMGSFGGPISYSVTVTNTGSSAANGITLIGLTGCALPATTLVSGGNMSCTVSVTASTLGTLTQTISISGLETDPDTTNNTASVTTNVQGVVAVGITGAGHGSVTSVPSGINCNSTCSAPFDALTTITLTAQPANDAVFGGWSGCDTASGRNCTVTVNANRNVVATFNGLPDLVISSISGLATGTVGNPFTVSVSTTNKGSEAAVPSTTSVYVSSDATITASDTLLSNVAIVSLAAGSSSTSSLTVASPAGLVTGTYYWGAIADSISGVVEGNLSGTGESNNATTGNAITINGVPAAPSNLTATVNSSSKITLNWADNATDEKGFYIERSTNGINFTKIETVGVNVKSYSNSNLISVTTYYYRVRAYNSRGNSMYSNTVSAKTK